MRGNPAGAGPCWRGIGYCLRRGGDAGCVTSASTRGQVFAPRRSARVSSRLQRGRGVLHRFSRALYPKRGSLGRREAVPLVRLNVVLPHAIAMEKHVTEHALRRGFPDWQATTRAAPVTSAPILTTSRLRAWLMRPQITRRGRGHEHALERRRSGGSEEHRRKKPYGDRRAQRRDAYAQVLLAGGGHLSIMHRRPARAPLPMSRRRHALHSCGRRSPRWEDRTRDHPCWTRRTSCIIRCVTIRSSSPEGFPRIYHG